mmetsp:Transcript_22543/g.53261  ORF Transcript_22543/g.53261 Transcript_22543/m.53261 type:complete len:202 (-) Transcript_22543:1992-2597(-)
MAEGSTSLSLLSWISIDDMFFPRPSSLARIVRHREEYSLLKSEAGSSSINPNATASSTAREKEQASPTFTDDDMVRSPRKAPLLKSSSNSLLLVAPGGGETRKRMYDIETDMIPSIRRILSPLVRRLRMVLMIGSAPPTVTSLLYSAENLPNALSALDIASDRSMGPPRPQLFAVTIFIPLFSQSAWSLLTSSSPVQSKMT